MSLEQPRGAFGKISIVFATKLKSFSFLPVLKKLPTENRVKSESSKLNKALGENGAGETTDEGTYKAEVVYVSDMESQDITKHSETRKHNTKSAVAPAVAQTEIGCRSPEPSSNPLNAAGIKPPRIPQFECHNTEAELTSGHFFHTGNHREDEVLSPVSSVDLFTSPFSSKESILGEGWEQEAGWSAVQMLSPRSSSCSSVRSGTFTPSVMRIKSHKLAPGSSLMQMPLTSCQTLGCNKHITSPCPLSSRARHRPPPTQLSLLTAILRKGRLPILSPSLHRPYSPCWPISPVNMSSCTACSAASTVAPMVGLRAKSCVSGGTTCTEPGCKLRAKPPGLAANTGSVPQGDRNTQRLSSTPDATRSSAHVARSAIKSPEKSSFVMSNYSPPALSPERLSKQPHKGIRVSPDPSFLLDSYSSRPAYTSPESKLSSQTDGNRHKSNTSPIVRNAESPSDLKSVQISPELFLAPDQNLIRQAQEVTIPERSPGLHLRSDRKILHEVEEIYPPAFPRSPSPRVSGLPRLTASPSVSPTRLSPRPGSCISPSERYTLSQSPPVSYHHLSPSPSYSLRSSPVSSLRESSPDCIDRASKRPHKIKSTYKAFAAIPTNTLLLEQQAIDDEVDKKNNSLDPTDSFAWEDPHSQMCSPAQLRQQSQELYEVIDEVLKDTVQSSPSSPAKQLTVRSETTRRLTPSPPPRSLGRETKYANFHVRSPTPAEKTLTKPGVIRAAVFMPRLEDNRERVCFSSSYQRQQDSPVRSSTDLQSQVLSRTSGPKHEPHGRRGFKMDPDSTDESLVSNRSRERGTPSPRRAPL